MPNKKNTKILATVTQEQVNKAITDIILHLPARILRSENQLVKSLQIDISNLKTRLSLLEAKVNKIERLIVK